MAVYGYGVYTVYSSDAELGIALAVLAELERVYILYNGAEAELVVTRVCKYYDIAL